jgi:hypothetical protein
LPKALHSNTARQFADFLSSLTLVFACLLTIWTVPKKFNWIAWGVTIAWIIFLLYYQKVDKGGN